MKKKFSLFSLIIFYFFNLTINAYAKPACDLFYKDLKNNFIEYELDSRPVYEYDDYGFNLQVRFNSEKDMDGFE